MSGETKKRIGDLEAEIVRLKEAQPTLRDQFAMAALIGCMDKVGGFNPAVHAEDAYAMANAMMRQRAKEQG